ncbi:hypothetical protein EJB05_23298, partial [Eragrostis curvula]
RGGGCGGLRSNDESASLLIAALGLKASGHLALSFKASGLLALRDEVSGLQEFGVGERSDAGDEGAVSSGFALSISFAGHWRRAKRKTEEKAFPAALFLVSNAVTAPIPASKIKFVATVTCIASSIRCPPSPPAPQLGAHLLRRRRLPRAPALAPPPSVLPFSGAVASRAPLLDVPLLGAPLLRAGRAGGRRGGAATLLRLPLHYPAPGCHTTALGCLYTIAAAATRLPCSGRASGRRSGASIQFGSVDTVSAASLLVIDSFI